MMRPLEGVRVVEMATVIAAPSCGRQLACLGAEVIKVEPTSGDPYRTTTAMTDEIPVIFDVLNAQKRCIALNAKDPEAREYLLKIIGDADVFLSNIRADGLGRLGLSYDELKAINPKLIYVHFSGYGEKGELASLPGYDATTFFTRSGLYRDFTSPENEPVNHVYGMGDMISGMALSLNILAALMERQHTGSGQKLECALNQIGAWVMLLPMVYEQFGSFLQRREGEPADIANATMRCGDGEYMYYGLGTPKQWTGFCRALDVEYLLEDPRCGSFADIVANTPTLAPEISAALQKRGAEEWVRILRAHDVPCERHRHMREMAQDKQLLANGYSYRTSYPHKDVTIPAPPVQPAGDGLPTAERGAPLGAHTAQLLKEYGCTQQKLVSLKQRGSVVAP